MMGQALSSIQEAIGEREEEIRRLKQITRILQGTATARPRVVSIAARRKMAEAQRRRWKLYHGKKAA